jgi:aromatic ring-opening dioxygenase catalytic subunit (LigB family)
MTPTWRQAIDSLPSTPENIPAFFFAHGSPALESARIRAEDPMFRHQGSGSPLYDFLKVFGPALLEKYKPKGIVVFSAHWETQGETLGELLTVHPCFRANIHDVQ